MKDEIEDHDRVQWTSADNVKMEGFVLGAEIGSKEKLCIVAIDSPKEFYGRVVWLVTKDLTLTEKYKDDKASEEDEEEESEVEVESEEPEEDAEGYF